MTSNINTISPLKILTPNSLVHNTLLPPTAVFPLHICHPLMEHFVTFNRGIIYNLSFKQKNWIKTLKLQTETAIALLPTQQKDYIRFQLVHNIKPLYKQYDSTKQYITNHAKNE